MPSLILGTCYTGAWWLLSNLKFNSARRNKYLSGLREGLRKYAAAEAAGVSFMTVHRYRRKNPEFAEQEDIAEMDSAEIVENALFQAAQSGNTTAMIFYLCNRVAARWQSVNKIHLGGGLDVRQILETPKLIKSPLPGPKGETNEQDKGQ